MRILHFYKNYYPESMGGIEQVIRQLCISSQKLGCETEVLTLTQNKTPKSFIFEGHRLHCAPINLEIASNRMSWHALFKLAKLAPQFDIIHYHFPWPFMDIAHFIGRVRQTSVVTYHSDIIRQKNLLKLYRPLRDRFLNAVDQIVATSPNYLATSDVLKQYAHKTISITYGLDKSLYPDPKTERMAYWRTRCKERFFLFVGVLRYYKGLHILLDSAANTQLPIVIIGAGPIEVELKSHAQRLKLNNVLFLGALPDEDKIALIKLSYAIIFPSHLRAEAFGISLLEGAMLGKPMISSEIGTGTSYINIHNQTGLVVPPSDPLALRCAMLSLWNDPASAQTMGQNAQKRYWSHFQASNMANQYHKLYSELLKSKKLSRL